MALRVIQWATGGVGRQALRALIRDPDLELAGVYVSRAEKVGCDAAELAGLDASTGIIASDDAEALIRVEADCVVYTAVGETRVGQAIAELCAILRSGKNVVSTSMMNLIYPPAAPTRLTEPLAEACREGGATLFTHGIDPGFSGDIMALAALRLCDRVRSIRVQELADYGSHPDLSWAAPFGFGKSPEVDAPLLSKGVPKLFWGGMVKLLADALGAELEEIRETSERWCCEETIEVPMLRLEKGTVAAIRFEVAGIVRGRPAIVAEHVSRMRPDMAPDWPSPPDGRKSVHRVSIDGSPSLTLDLELDSQTGQHGRGGLSATAHSAVNAIPAVCAAEPGLMSMLDLPLAPGRRLLHPI